MSICVDSSFLVSKYLQDVHSLEADLRMASMPYVWITPLNRVEAAHAIFQHSFRKLISVAAAQSALDSFEQDCKDGLWTDVEWPATVWERSIDLAALYGPALGVRTLDSLHVASALELGATKFWTFDERQERLANAVGLDVSA